MSITLTKNIKGPELHLILFSLQFLERVCSTAIKEMSLKACIPRYVDQFDIVLTQRRFFRLFVF